ncbi:MAG TPA: hypothetical protein VJ873_09810 [bacterium]|nr:hypothetical protein [bacterium]
MKKKTAIVGLLFCFVLGLELCGCEGKSPVAPGYYRVAPTATAFPTSTFIPTATPILVLPTPTVTPILGI